MRLPSTLTLCLAAGLMSMPAFAQSPATTTPMMPPSDGVPPPPETRMTQPDQGSDRDWRGDRDHGDRSGRKGGWDRRGGMGGMGMGGMGGMGMGMGGMAAHQGFMRLIFILADTDGDGALSLEEVQAVHARIFKAVDTDGDGKVTLDEMRSFMRSFAGGGRFDRRGDDHDDKDGGG
jgi:hypothetical protein